MAKYRCPTCGAPHKELTDQCRQCGAMMDPSMKAMPTAVQADAELPADKYSPKGISHFILWGALGIIIVLGGAIALGVGSDDDGIQWVRDNVPGLGADPDDGWVAWEDPDEVVATSTPGDLTADGEFPVSDFTAFTREVGDTQVVAVGYTTDGYNDGAAEDEDSNIQLLDALAQEWVAAQGGELTTDNDVKGAEGARPYLDARFDGVSLPDGAAFGNVRLIRVGDEVVFVQTISYEESPDSQARMRGDLEIIADRPPEDSSSS